MLLILTSIQKTHFGWLRWVDVNVKELLVNPYSAYSGFHQTGKQTVSVARFSTSYVRRHTTLLQTSAPSITVNVPFCHEMAGSFRPALFLVMRWTSTSGIDCDALSKCLSSELKPFYEVSAYSILTTLTTAREF